MAQTYLGDLLELGVGVAALLGRLQRNLVVVHEGLVNAQLAGLGQGQREKRCYGGNFIL